MGAYIFGMEKNFYTVDEVAEMLGFTPKLIRRLITDGILEAVKIRSIYRITPEQIETFVKNNTTKPAQRTDQELIMSEEDPNSN